MKHKHTKTFPIDCQPLLNAPRCNKSFTLQSHIGFGISWVNGNREQYWVTLPDIFPNFHDFSLTVSYFSCYFNSVITLKAFQPWGHPKILTPEQWRYRDELHQNFFVKNLQQTGWEKLQVQFPVTCRQLLQRLQVMSVIVEKRLFKSHQLLRFFLHLSHNSCISFNLLFNRTRTSHDVTWILQQRNFVLNHCHH